MKEDKQALRDKELLKGIQATDKTIQKLDITSQERGERIAGVAEENLRARAKLVSMPLVEDVKSRKRKETDTEAQKEKGEGKNG